jgi:hypothetical protein
MTDERDEIIRELTRHCGDGRLTLDELEARIQEVYAAETDEEARHALRELPVARTEPYRRDDDPVRAAAPPPPRSAPVPPPAPPAEQDPDWEKPVGTLICIAGFVLLFNGMFWLAMICWFVLPGLVLHSKRG